MTKLKTLKDIEKSIIKFEKGKVAKPIIVFLPKHEKNETVDGEYLLIEDLKQMAIEWVKCVNDLYKESRSKYAEALALGMGVSPKLLKKIQNDYELKEKHAFHVKVALKTIFNLTEKDLKQEP